MIVNNPTLEDEWLELIRWEETHENSVENLGVIGTLMKISSHTKSQG